MSTKFSPEVLKELRDQERAALSQAWTLEELERLSHLFQDHNWPLFLRCLDKLTDKLDEQVWGSERMDLETLYYLRGQRRVIKILQGLPVEIEQGKERLKEHFDLERAQHDTETGS
jgi:hypothetical protein